MTSLLPRCLQDQRLLRDLDLKGNRLEVLPADVLQEAASLQTIDLSRNQLASVEPDALRGNRYWVLAALGTGQRQGCHPAHPAQARPMPGHTRRRTGPPPSTRPT